MELGRAMIAKKTRDEIELIETINKAKKARKSKGIDNK